ncbi:MAG: hypothetical protein JSV80_17230 [Acidobacteriota bacterium]|nr:MAG: hypothetical protein JSV80_17230 [Acidobacteriota bacterium]
MSTHMRRSGRFIGVLLAVIVLVALVVFTALRLYGASRLSRAQAAFDESTADVQELAARIAAASAKPLEPTHNAARFLEAGASAVIWSEEDQDLVSEASLAPAREWESEQTAKLYSVISRQEAALALLHRAADIEQSDWGVDETRGAAAELPDLIRLLKAARLLLIEGRVALADERIDDALLSVASLSTLGESIKQTPFLLCTLVGIAIERMELHLAGEVLGMPDLSAPQLARLRSLAEGAPPIDTLRFGLITETRDVRATFQNAETPLSLRGLASIALWQLEAASGLDDVREFLDSASVPYAQTLVTREKASPPRASWFSRLVSGRPTTPNLKNAIARAQSVAAERQKVLAGIAVYELALSTHYLPAARPDLPPLGEPDPLTGQPLLYERLPDGRVQIEIDGGRELLSEIIPRGATRAARPVMLPARR